MPEIENNKNNKSPNKSINNLYRKFILEDLAILTGATVVSYESGIELSKATKEMLGTCKRFITTKESTTIIEGGGSKELIEQRANQIRE